MCLLALGKLRDVEGFTTDFVGPDLLARRVLRYAYVFPFVEATEGVLIIAGWATWFDAPLAILIGGIGAVSVVKAIYGDRRELKCACVGGGSSVPLSYVSLTENLLMVRWACGCWSARRRRAPATTRSAPRRPSTPPA